MRSEDVTRRVQAAREEMKGSSGWACLLFGTLLACAFWAGAFFASHPLIH